MGKVQISSTALPLMTPEKYPVTDSVLYAVLSGDNISNAITNITLTGMATKIEKMRRYAVEEYVYGLPNGSTDTEFTAPKADIEAAIADSEGHAYGVSAELYLQDSLTIYYAVLPYMTETFGYVPQTNRIYTFPETVEFSGFSLSGHIATYKVLLSDIALASDNLTVTMTFSIETYYIDDADEQQTDPVRTFTADHVIDSNLVLESAYCIASYYVLDSGGVETGDLQWWFYDQSTLVYPALHGTPQEEAGANFLPIIPLRLNNVDLMASKSGDTYDTTKTLLKKISISLDDTMDRLNSNPDIGDIDNAYIAFCINLQTEENIGIWYLGEFYDYLNRGAQVNSWDIMNDVFNLHDETTPSYIKNIYTAEVGKYEAAIYESQFRVKLTYSSITTIFKNGSIGDVGTATKTLVADSSGYEAYEANNGNTYWRKNPSNSRMHFKLQITPYVYKEVIVEQPTHVNNIYRRYSTETTITDLVEDPGNLNFIVPVHYDVVQGMHRRMQSALYQESLVMVLNTFERQDLAWYETTAFQCILMAVALVISIYSGPLGTALTGLAQALSAGFMAVVMFVLKAVVISLVIGQVMKLIAKVIGPKLAAILAVVVAVVAATYGGSLGNISAMGGTMPTSQLLLSCSQALLSGAQENLNEQMMEIAADAQDFEAEAERKTAELAETQDMMDLLEPLSFDFLQIQQAQLLAHPVTDPEKFYDVTIHIGNIGTKVLDIIPEYHSEALKLPEVDNLAFTKTKYAV